MKNYKKVVSAIAALSMVASSIVMPMSASADGSYAPIGVVEGKAVVYDCYQAGVAIVATYGEDGRLSKVVTKDVAAGEAAEFDVAVGDKVMLWDGLGTDEPIADAVTVTEDMMATQPPATQTPTPPPTVPDPTPAGDVIASWKFDFGSADDVAEGYTAVTPDKDYMQAKDYGFLGLTEDDYKVGNRYDGFGLQEGQIITLAAGGTTGLNDAIGSVGEDLYGNAGDKYYPTRFALKVEDEQYFRVKATVTTLDPTKEANASLYTERKHPIYTDKVIAPGESVTTEFTIRTTPIYYEKSTPKGEIADGMVNVAVSGENTALAVLEIEQIESAPTVWVLGDSTVTDGNCSLPYFEGKNYTGVGTGLTKYLPSNIAMVNEGEGGLNAADNAHFNMVKNRIKAGDYLYLEYGHNHKSDGPTGYLAQLDKYYNVCHEVGATLIIVSPIERINTFSENAYQHSLSGFAEAGEGYVADKVAAGATDIAYVDLNKYSLDFYNRICTKEDGSVDASLIKYYFQTEKGGATDTTHPNDFGAESLAYEFFKAAQAVTDETQKVALAGILDNMRAELPTPVSAEIIAGGLGGDAWPTYVVPDLPDLPVVIDEVIFDESGNLTQVNVTTRAAKLAMTAYGIIVVKVKDSEGNAVGTIYAKAQVDNSTGYGSQEITEFTTGVTMPEGGSYEAQVWQALDNGGDIGLTVDPANVAYSVVAKPTNIEKYILVGEDTDVETFVYYDKTSLDGAGNWVAGGSAGKDFTLATGEDGVPYARIMSDGAKNGSANQGSFYLMRPLDNLVNEEGTAIGTGSSGIYMIEFDAIYANGGGLNVALAENTTPNKSPFVAEQITAFSMGNNGVVTINGTEAGTISPLEWTNVKYIINLNSGVAELSVNGGTPVTAEVAAYASFNEPSMSTLKHFVLEGQKVAFDFKIANLTVAKLKDDGATTTLNVSIAGDNTGFGEVYVGEAGTTSATVAQSETIAAVAVPNDGYVFTGWYADGALFSNEETVSLRLYKDLALEATFAKQAGVEGVVSFAIAADKSLVKAGATATLSVADVVDKAGNEVEYSDSDVTWSTDAAGVSVDGGVVTIAEDFAIDANSTVDVAVNATINNITKTYTLTVYSYAFYENATGGAVSSGTWDGPIGTWGGKNAVAWPGGGGTYTLTLNEAVALDATTTLSYQTGAGGSNNKLCGQPRYFEIYDSNGNKVVNEVLGYSWGSFFVGGSIGGSSIDGASAEFASAAVLNSVTDPIVITINTDGTGTVAMGATTANITVNTAATDIASIKLMSKSGAPNYDARGLGMTEIVISK